MSPLNSANKYILKEISNKEYLKNFLTYTAKKFIHNAIFILTDNVKSIIINSIFNNNTNLFKNKLLNLFITEH